MANELEFDSGVDVTLTFALANPAANATTALLFAQGGTGFVVPAGYEFHPICISGASNADLTAGTATFTVTRDGTVLSAGPTAALSDTVQKKAGVQRVNADPIAAGVVVGVSVVASAAYAPVTADLDCVLIGKLLPAY